jgi:hypothetical protein
MTSDEPGYRSYLLRLWTVRRADVVIWRASLEDPHTGERVGFADLDHLFAFLLRRTTAIDETSTSMQQEQEPGDR